MKLISDYHTHPQGHRIRHYSERLLQPWVEAARARGLSDIAFTDHDRFHAGINFDVLTRIRETNPQLKIRAGIELDNDPRTSAAGRKWIEKNWDKLDFVLGSVHYLDNPVRMFDSIPDGARQFDGRKIEDVYADYFRRVREIAVSGLVDCMSHLDLIKIHGHRPTRDIGPMVEETLELIRSRDLAIELSTAGWRKPVKELYPGDRIIKLAVKKRIPFTTASDAHSHAQLAENFEQLAEKMSIFGIREVCVYEKHKRATKKL
ncbi:MAG TPA: histidinol-phosphatase HisJ family protein [Chthoniobacterales bacterium]|nr:histidinol-phosphatase HisJ family protein [Chthoniobacterales bacterium]